MEIEADAKKEGWLLLLDAYYPGWKAEVDRKPVEIMRADGFFRAVPVAAGRHEIVFYYFPKLFRVSLLISGTGLLFWIALLFISLRSGRQPASQSGK